VTFNDLGDVNSRHDFCLLIDTVHCTGVSRERPVFDFYLVHNPTAFSVLSTFFYRIARVCPRSIGKTDNYDRDSEKRQNCDTFTVGFCVRNCMITHII